ncbi:DUF3515 family protein [Streptomyces chitinivorans]|uniref:DUF3515 family protein n=1 Tax=Streptomyces chitinivorans TaxID=1257027 RepID=A0ABW7HQN2_9ACTN|nr:DUF3515 family protein [Streptomyces chitinivorans]MDH2407961.1 DUF3515 family protein [Streptomyces chitinivorans]
MRKQRRSSFLLLGVVAVAVASVSCSGPSLLSSGHSVRSGPFSGDPLCADVVSGAPEEVLSWQRDGATGTGTASWGGASVVLRCGVEPMPPTPDLCMNVSGVDWVLDEGRLEADGVQVLTTYGRTPAVEVTIEDAPGHAGDVLVDMNRSVRDIPRKSKCLSPGEVP